MAVVLALAFGEAIAHGSPPVPAAYHTEDVELGATAGLSSSATNTGGQATRGTRHNFSVLPEQSETPGFSRDTAGGSSTADHVRARTAIHDVLARAEFADLRRDNDASQRRLLRWLESLWRSIDSALRHLPAWLLWVIVFWMFVALLAILAHLLYTLWKLLGGSARSSDAAGGALGRGGELLGIRDLDFDSVYAEARRLLSGGDWPAAIKYYYVAAILWLDRRGAIAFQPSKTNRDYFRELRARAGLQGLFGRLTNCFEHVVYAGQAATASNSRAMAEAVEGLLHESA